MLSDDEILDRVRARASALRRRRRLALGGGGTLLVTIVVLAGMAVAVRDTGSHVVSTADRPATTETSAPEETTTTTSPPPSSTTIPPTEPQPPESLPIERPGAGTAPETDGSTTTVPLEPPPPSPMILGGRVLTQDGLTVEASVMSSGVPGDLSLHVRIRLHADRGSHVGGHVWSDIGISPRLKGFGDQSHHPDSCDVVQGSQWDDSTPDPNGAPVDSTFELVLVAAEPGEYVISVLGWSSACYAERALSEVVFTITTGVPFGG